MSMEAPLKRKEEAEIAAAAQAADASGSYVEAPFDGTVDAVKMIATAALTGANTDSRTIQLFNRKQDGTGTTKVAEKAFVSGVSAAADAETDIPVITTGTPAANVVAAGDVLELVSLHVGAGLASPAASFEVEFTRS